MALARPLSAAPAPAASLGTRLVPSRLVPFKTSRAAPLRPTRQRAAPVQMVKTETRTLEAGFKAPDFTLPEPLTGNTVTLSEYAAGAPATLVMIICNHCPFVVHLKPAIVELAKEYQAKGAKILAISSNSVETHPQDGPEAMAEDAVANGYTFPYLFDATQEVAKAYQAACTPEFLVFDQDLRLQYHGQFDASRPSKYGASAAVTGQDLRAALDAVLVGRPAPTPWKPSIGCNVKWTPGNEPPWFGLNIVATYPEPETEKERSPIDYPQEWITPQPSRRPDIFPEFERLATPMPKPLPGDPELPDEGEEEEEEKKKKNPDDPDKEEEGPKPDEPAPSPE